MKKSQDKLGKEKYSVIDSLELFIWYLKYSALSKTQKDSNKNIVLIRIFIIKRIVPVLDYDWLSRVRTSKPL